MLAKSILKSIETLISQALIDMDIRDEKFSTSLKEKYKNEKMKKTLRNVNEKQENMKLNSANSKAYIEIIDDKKNF